MKDWTPKQKEEIQAAIDAVKRRLRPLSTEDKVRFTTKGRLPTDVELREGLEALRDLRALANRA